ncbi:MAG: hypothetical protein Q8O74_07075, partial [bacterium]|nr:hypothetical protein [bacterium]
MSLGESFPNINKEPFIITSPPTTSYNCIAWACSDNTKWYWPDKGNYCYWPSNITRTETIAAFIRLFESLGFTVCRDGKLEPEYIKIALYLDVNGIPTHVARQLSDGNWTSKLGTNYDIT